MKHLTIALAFLLLSGCNQTPKAETNVRPEILNAFWALNEDLQTSNGRLRSHSDDTYEKFDKELDKSLADVHAYYDKAQITKGLAERLVDSITAYKHQIIVLAAKLI